MHICFVENFDGFKICLVNDYGKEIKGKVTYALKTLKGETVWEKTANLTAPPDSVDKINVLVEGEGDYLVGEFVSEDGKTAKTVYFHNLWKDKKFESDISYSVKEIEENIYAVEIKANAFARTVFVDYPTSEGLIYSDNFFDLEKDGKETVIIKSESPLDLQKITVKTYADEWSE